MEKILVVGAGGHARVIVDILRQNDEYEVAGLIDSDASKSFWGIPVLGGDNDLTKICQMGEIKYAFVALGDGRLREKVTKKVLSAGFKLVNVVSQNAIVSKHVQLKKGIAIMPGAVINADVKIENGCIINTNSSVDHEGYIGEYTHIAPGCAISGKVRIGKHCLLGTGSRVIDQVYIGDDTIVGAGAVVVRNLQGSCTAVGVPAKIIKF